MEFGTGGIPELPDVKYQFREVNMDMMNMKAGPIESRYIIFDDKALGMTACVFNQQRLGSCTANAVAAAYNYELQKLDKKHAAFKPSRLFLYYAVRYTASRYGSLQITPEQWEDLRTDTQKVEMPNDSGAWVSSTVRVMAHIGAPWDEDPPAEYRESAKIETYKYSDQKEDDRWKEVPPQECFTYAAKHMSLETSLAKRDEGCWKSCIRAGYPIIFSYTFYNSFRRLPDDPRYAAPKPVPQSKPPGGHTVIAVGWDDEREYVYEGKTHRGCFRVQNSWGESWGDKGFFWMPYTWLTDTTLNVDMHGQVMVYDECWTLWGSTEAKEHDH